jgi:hypothetical protein
MVRRRLDGVRRAQVRDSLAAPLPWESRLVRFETLIRGGKGVEAALELLDDERLTEHHAHTRQARP